ncbi:ABC-type multidrug transport system ATPase subunit [Actinomadura pelletieri DSM 43383]|uniref:ABC-type multidrug transport system ATPase subunit n=1 Tax=Actinomadura pelletieri DSM 43383 TaxID=1120940 RepID=A0A495QG60_9ACTN|nr:ABC transporter ATP-binding protein [Actinomadura pelletieri]RKS70896.1 ABC-type multidrug transport system ATPase subunit [Actinomadura pelletieri DSM 43383]
MVVQLQGISKRYERDRLILRDVDLEVAPEERLAIVGGNGSGKSTLLRIVVGLSRPSTGTVRSPKGAIGYVPERFPCHDRMSAASYLRHIGRIRGLRSRAARLRADELLERLELVGGSGTPLRRLSKGNAQKVAVAQAMMVPPRLLVLDEPASGLAESVHGVLADLLREAASGGAVLFTEHHDEFVRKNATRICRITEGSLEPATSPPEAEQPRKVFRVAVVPKPPAASCELDWANMQGVLRTRRSGEEVEIHVLGEHQEAILLTALQNGWSITAVTSET